MSLFIKIKIDMNKCVGMEKCGKCEQICPVNIFLKKGNNPTVVYDNEDECTLCDLCLNECTPNAISIKKLY
ncbi:MAG: ferredoxin [Candidatus Cloacimonadota bacterium]|nr:MAG: ferredoxin [Candidatus Cloacimonadota bacterium]